MRLCAFAVMVLAGIGGASGQEAALRARIKIDSERRIGEIDRNICTLNVWVAQSKTGMVTGKPFG